MAVQIEAAERAARGLELMVGEGYRIKIGVMEVARNKRVAAHKQANARNPTR